MSPIAVIVLIVVILVVIAAIVFGVQAAAGEEAAEHVRTRVRPGGGRHRQPRGRREGAARTRERRHAELELKPLSPESQARYSAAWEEVQIQFVDDPDRRRRRPPTSWSPS